MPPTIQAILGPARCGKTHQLLVAYRQKLAQGPFGAALWLSPTHRSATRVREQILTRGLAGCFNPNCLTFDQFARRVLESSKQAIRPIGPLLQRQILRQQVDEALAGNRLSYFQPIAHTPGFLDLLVQFIQELKRLEIWPEELDKAIGRRASSKDRDLHDLYERYQQVLTAHDLYDPQGRFWSARALLRDGQPQPFERLRHVFVDGFTDFTRTEHEILEILAGRVETLSITLTLEPGSSRRDLFYKSANTFTELRRRHPALRTVELPRRAPSWPGMAHLEQKLFANPGELSPASDSAGLEIVAAAGETSEIELLARRIKKLLTQGDGGNTRIRPGEILVVFRSLSDVDDLVRSTFSEFGIPVAIGSIPALERAPIMSALVGWLRLDQQDWPFRQLLAVLVHNYFRPKWPEWQQGRAAAAAERLVRRLQIPSGRSALLVQLERLATIMTPQGANEEDRASSSHVQAKLALPLVVRMSRMLDALPTRATFSEWAAAATELAITAGMLPSDTGQAAVESADQMAWSQLMAALGAKEQLSNWLNLPPAVLSRGEFFEHLKEALRCEPAQVGQDETGCVRVLSAESVRNLSAPYVFLAGLSEKAFPPPNRENCIHSEADAAQLIAAGLPLVPHAERSRHEMLLFYEVVTRATRRLILSYSALDQSAQPLSPSPYLIEIERAYGPGRIERHEQPDLSGVPKLAEVSSPRDFRTRAVADALEGNHALLVQLKQHPATAEAADSILASLTASSARQRGAGFGQFEGMIESDAGREVLRKRFGESHIWSPSQLEQYARCPFQFFLDRVLLAKPVEDPALIVDYARRGQMVHWLLSTLHRNLNEQAQSHSSPSQFPEKQFAATIAGLIGDLLTRVKNDRPLDHGLRRLDSQQVAKWLGNYHRQHGKYDAAWIEWDAPLRPAHFEVSFGPRHHRESQQDELQLDTDDSLSTLDPFELICGEEIIRFAGRIDRIDLGAVGGEVVFSIVDYKSSVSARARAKLGLEDYALQLPLYALAAQEMLSARGALPFRAAYWHVAGEGYKEAVKCYIEAGGRLEISPDWESLSARLRKRIRALVEGIRQGQFPMHSADDECTGHCPYSTTCRVNQVRALGKAWQAPVEEAS